jgi:hypothetical protein
MTIEEAQAALQVIAAELLAIDDRLQVIVAQLPHHPQEEEMLEGTIPCDVATELRGAIEVTISDDIRSAFRRVERAARVTDEELRKNFRRLS